MAAHRAGVILSCLLAISILCILAACVIGSADVSFGDLLEGFRALVSGTPGSLGATLLDLRLTRAFGAFVTGGTLALAGVMMQALLRNPLADPYVLGVSGGAAVGALLAMLFFASMWV